MHMCIDTCFLILLFFVFAIYKIARFKERSDSIRHQRISLLAKILSFVILIINSKMGNILDNFPQSN